MPSRNAPVACLVGAAATVTLVAAATMSFGGFGPSLNRTLDVRAAPATSANHATATPTAEIPSAQTVPTTSPAETEPAPIGWSPQADASPSDSRSSDVDAATVTAGSTAPRSDASHASASPGATTTGPPAMTACKPATSVPDSDAAARSDAADSTADYPAPGDTAADDTTAVDPTVDAAASSAAVSHSATAPSSTPSATHDGSAGNRPSAIESTIAERLLTELNFSRAERGLPPLAAAPSLQSGARAHNLAMATADSLTLGASGDGDNQSQGSGSTGAPAAEIVGCAELPPGAADDGVEAAALALGELMRATLSQSSPAAPGVAHGDLARVGAATMVGIDVYLDADGTRLWITQVFAVAQSG